MAFMFSSPSASLLLFFAAAALYVCKKAYRSRKIIADLRRQGMPMPPFSWAAGHLLAASPFLEKLPADAIFNYSVAEMAREFREEKMFYLDFWPINDPFLIVADPQAASQLMRSNTAPKPASVSAALASLTGGPNLFTMPDDEWKFWRSIFSPGFSASQMLGQVPVMLSAAQTFRGVLRKKAESRELFRLEEATCRMTLDIIGLVTLGSSFDYQIADNEFPTRLRSLVRWTSFGAEVNPFRRWNPIRPLMCWYQGRYVDNFIREELKKKIAKRRGVCNPCGEDDDEHKSIASTALDKYLDKVEGKAGPTPSPEEADATFLRYGAAQARLFLVAGHDTTSSTLTYALHLLHTHPPALARLRAEHDAVFGPDASAAGARLASDPSLLNALPFTTAAVKETLRLFPPASGIRMGGADTVLTTAGTGSGGKRSYPTANCSVWVVHAALHRDPDLWPRPDDFLPERWLVAPDDPLWPGGGGAGAWRPFEVGPRACLGQTLAMAELKLALAVTAREFDVRPAYEEWYARHPKAGVRATPGGELAYQVEGGGGGAHAAEQYPCRVSLRS